jgi:hypothetical protein
MLKLGWGADRALSDLKRRWHILGPFADAEFSTLHEVLAFTDCLILGLCRLSFAADMHKRSGGHW